VTTAPEHAMPRHSPGRALTPQENTGDDPEVEELRVRSQALTRRLDEDVSHFRLGGASPIRLLGQGLPEIMDALARLEARSTRSVWSLQPKITFDPDHPSIALDARSRARGLDLQLIVSKKVQIEYPLLPVLRPNARVGPVFLQAIIIDAVVAVLEGPRTATGESAAWLTTSRPYVDEILKIWSLSVSLSAPLVDPDAAPPLSTRQVEVALDIARGATDKSIARRLHSSRRTIERDVHEVLAFLGARSRAEAVRIMRGGTRWPQPS